MVVVNMKGKGTPDWDDVREKAAEEAGVSLEAVEAYCSDNFLYELWSDDLQHFKEELDVNGVQVYSVGRSGGYLGVEFMGDMLIVDEDKLKKAAEKFIKEKGADLIKKEEDDIDNEEDIVRVLFAEFTDDRDALEWDTIGKLDSDWKSALKDMAETIKAEAEYWENQNVGLSLSLPMNIGNKRMSDTPV